MTAAFREPRASSHTETSGGMATFTMTVTRWTSAPASFNAVASWDARSSRGSISKRSLAHHGLGRLPGKPALALEDAGHARRRLTVRRAPSARCALRHGSRRARPSRGSVAPQ